ncbi:hypothetical protein SAMN05444390_1061, partial [Marinobacterium lutimaris]
WKTASLVVCNPEGRVVSSEEAHSTDLPEGVNRLFEKVFKKVKTTKNGRILRGVRPF